MSTYLRSVLKLQALPCKKLIVAHGAIIDPPYDELIDANIQAVVDTLEKLGCIICRPMTMDEISVAVRGEMGIVVDTVEKALSFERFLRPYLECMLDHDTHILTLKNGIPAYGPKE
jgi:hypothetical protein